MVSITVFKQCDVAFASTNPCGSEPLPSTGQALVVKPVHLNDELGSKSPGVRESLFAQTSIHLGGHYNVVRKCETDHPIG